MRWAKFNGKKIEATKGAEGYCPACEEKLIPKDGGIIPPYWSHKPKKSS